MNRSAIDLWVGIFVAIGFGAILFMALKVGNLLTLDRSPGYRLEANFDNIGGLKLRAPVKTAGVVVGRVESIRLELKTYEAVATLRIDNQYRVHAKTRSHRSIPRACWVRFTSLSTPAATRRCSRTAIASPRRSRPS